MTVICWVHWGLEQCFQHWFADSTSRDLINLHLQADIHFLLVRALYTTELLSVRDCREDIMQSIWNKNVLTAGSRLLGD